MEVKVPKLIGLTEEEAEATLKESNLKLGKIEKKVTSDPDKYDKVIDQNPSADLMIQRGRSINITIAIKS